MTVLRSLATVWLVFLVSLPATLAQPEKPVSTTALRKRAKQALTALKRAPDPDRVGEVLALVERLRQERKRTEALRYLKQAVKCAPHAFDAQLILAETLQESGKTKDATRLANRLVRWGETDAIRVGALRLLGEAPDLTIADLERPKDGKPHVILLPLGTAEVTLLKAVQRGLAERLSTDVLLRRVSFELPAPDHPRFENFFRDERRNLRFLLEDPSAAAHNTRKLIGLTAADLESDERVVAMSRKLVQMNGDESQLRRFDAYARHAREPQWNGNKLLSLLQKTVRPFRSGRVVFVALSGNDMFTGDFNFVYSWVSTGGFAVLSYNRFRTARNGEDPSWEVLLTRTLKQAICSTGRAVGIRSCRTPGCVFSTAMNLEQHDAKNLEPCEACGRALGRKLER